jgi:hypothetical protein
VNGETRPPRDLPVHLVGANGGLACAPAKLPSVVSFMVRHRVATMIAGAVTCRRCIEAARRPPANGTEIHEGG